MWVSVLGLTVVCCEVNWCEKRRKWYWWNENILEWNSDFKTDWNKRIDLNFFALQAIRHDLASIELFRSSLLCKRWSSRGLQVAKMAEFKVYLVHHLLGVSSIFLFVIVTWTNVHKCTKGIRHFRVSFQFIDPQTSKDFNLTLSSDDHKSILESRRMYRIVTLIEDNFVYLHPQPIGDIHYHVLTTWHVTRLFRIIININ